MITSTLPLSVILQCRLTSADLPAYDQGLEGALLAGLHAESLLVAERQLHMICSMLRSASCTFADFESEVSQLFPSMSDSLSPSYLPRTVPSLLAGSENKQNRI